MNAVAQLKKLCAEKAVESVSSGMVVGLGTGSTAYFAGIDDLKFVFSSH
jgi:ribose 5-phosphate isomerase